MKAPAAPHQPTCNADSYAAILAEQSIEGCLAFSFDDGVWQQEASFSLFKFKVWHGRG